MAVRLFPKLALAAAVLAVVTACAIKPAAMPAPTATVPAPAVFGQDVPVAHDNVRLTIPGGLASAALVGTIPALTTEDLYGPWEIAPQHVKIVLDHYPQFSLNTPQVLVYPAQEFAAMSQTGGDEDLRRLQAIVSGSAPVTAENMPSVPFLLSAQMIASHMQAITFKNGSGVRLVTHYANGFSPVTNYGMFYHFQGLTSDGKYYVIALLPVSADFLPDTDSQRMIENPTATDFPGYYNPDATAEDYAAYYQAVTDSLNSTPPEAFSPSLPELDRLIQSIEISP